MPRCRYAVLFSFLAPDALLFASFDTSTRHDCLHSLIRPNDLSCALILPIRLSVSATRTLVDSTRSGRAARDSGKGGPSGFRQERRDPGKIFLACPQLFRPKFESSKMLKTRDDFRQFRDSTETARAKAVPS